jgi:hypothetical protein
VIAIHWGGGARTPRVQWLAGFPCCTSGKKAWTALWTLDPRDVTCGRCKRIQQYWKATAPAGTGEAG